MTIVHFMGMRSTKYGGLEKFMVELACQLYKRNDKLYIIYNEEPYSQSYLDSLRKYNVSILIENFETTNIVHLYEKLKVIVNDLYPDIVHFHFGRISTFGPFIMRMLAVKKVFRSVRSMPFEDYSPNIKSHLYYTFLNCVCNNILCVSDAIRVDLDRCVFIKKEKIKVLYTGTNLYNLPSKVESTDAIRITCIAFHNPVKGIDVLLRALSLLREKYNLPDFICNQIGGGNPKYTKELKELARELNLERHINWMGLRDDVPEILSQTDIYCQPSRYEGIGISIMEACAQGIPVVASDVGGIPEVVYDSVNGLLFQPTNYEELAKYLYALMNNRQLAKEMGRKSRKIAENSFCLQKNVKSLLVLYY